MARRLRDDVGTGHDAAAVCVGDEIERRFRVAEVRELHAAAGLLADLDRFDRAVRSVAQV